MIVDAFILYKLLQLGDSSHSLYDVWFALTPLAPFCAIGGGAIGDRKGIGHVGAWLGVLGVMGVLLTFVLTGERRECPFCFQLISKKASVCPYCTEPVTPTTDSARRSDGAV